MRSSKWAFIIVGFVLCVGSAGEAHATSGRFGPEENINVIQAAGDPQYNLCYKTTTYNFVGGIYIKDDGYVLQKVGDYTNYIPLNAAKIKDLQKVGTLPTPLPPYSLSFWDYLFGYLMEVVFGLMVIGSLVKRFVSGKRG